MNQSPAPEVDLDEVESSDPPAHIAIAPGLRCYPSLGRITTLIPVYTDQEGIRWLLGHLFERSGLSIAEIAERMGCKEENIRQYLKGRRPNPGMKWFVKFITICGGNLKLELPG